MRAIWKLAVLSMVIFFAAAPHGAWAYSYGDANTEDVAETFKLIVADLNKSPADWTGAAGAHNERRAEIVSHFGEPVAATLDQNIKEQNADELIANYKALLVMNLSRRFNNALESVKDYSQSKLLLAKARATFEALKPYAEKSLSAQDLTGIEDDFEKALDAIGNPGLFGVGKKEADPDALKADVNRIYSKLEPLFPFKAAQGENVPSNGGTGGGTTGGEQDAISGNTQHAPMEHPNETNAGVTVGVIGGVVVIGAGAVWWARRKGLF